MYVFIYIDTYFLSFFVMWGTLFLINLRYTKVLCFTSTFTFKPTAYIILFYLNIIIYTIEIDLLEIKLNTGKKRI